VCLCVCVCVCVCVYHSINASLTVCVHQHSSHRPRPGLPEFRAPEMYDGAYTESVDVYSFGLAVLQMATMKLPFAECRHNEEQIRLQATVRVREGATVTCPCSLECVCVCVCVCVRVSVCVSVYVYVPVFVSVCWSELVKTFNFSSTRQLHQILLHVSRPLICLLLLTLARRRQAQVGSA
jgi:serine/threonine protein kinase